MKTMQISRKQQGFTIIELVVVILLLGILTATALPRFMDVTDEAHTSVVDAVEGGLRSGLAMYQAEWVAQGQPGAGSTWDSDMGQTPVHDTGNGYPGGDAADGGAFSGTQATDNELCLSIYTGLLQDGSPAIQAYEGVDSTATAPTDETTALSGSGNAVVFDTDFEAIYHDTASTGAAAYPADTDLCIYLYTGQDANVDRALVYAPFDGSVARFSDYGDGSSGSGGLAESAGL